LRKPKAEVLEMTRVIDAKEDTRCQILELQKKAEEKRSEDLEEILVVDQGRSRRTIDLVEEVKVLKREHNH
jgi:mevalonate kinase